MKILYVAKYIADDAMISGFQLMSVDRSMIILLLNGENWRSHKCNAFQYLDGCWQEEEFVLMPSLNYLTAAEGLFITLSEKEKLRCVERVHFFEVERANK